MRRLLPLTAVLAAIAGCGGGDDDEPGRTVMVQSGSTLDVVADEYWFDPQTIVLRGGGGELTIALENRGVLAHNLRVFEDGKDVGGTTTFTGGKTREAELRLEPGEYELVCTVGSHADLGMTGGLTVE